MKILNFTSAFRQGYGVGLVIKKQMEGLASTGVFDITIATEDFCEEEISSICRKNMHILGSGIGYDSFASIMHEVKPDIVIAHTPPFFSHLASFYDFQTVKIAQDYGEPWPSFFPKSESVERQKINLAKYQAMSHFHGHISISEFIKQSSRVVNSNVLYLGVDHICVEHKNNRLDLRATLGLPEKSFIITTLFRIGVGESYYKGFDLLIQIKKKLTQLLRCDNLHFLIVGRSVPPRNDAEEMFRENGFLIMDNVDDSAKQDIIEQSDLFISPSLWEGFNLPLAESQFLGTPAIAFALGAHPEVCPFVFDTVHELVSWVEGYFRNTGMRKWVAEIEQRYVKHNFMWEKNVAKLNVMLHGYQKAFLEKKSLQIQFANTEYTEYTEEYSNVLKEYLRDRGEDGRVCMLDYPGALQIQYINVPAPVISIIIPNCDHSKDLERCIQSIVQKSSYKNYEILIVENNSTDKDIFALYEYLQKNYGHIRVLRWPAPFNYSAVNNFAALHSKGEVLLFLNNDTQVISEDWLERMLDYAAKIEVGAVGAKLYYPDDTIQHGGVIVGIHGGIAGHAYKYFPRTSEGDHGRLLTVQNYSAVTGACLMTRKRVFEEASGFDERLALAFNDIDLCLKIREKGYRIVWTPYAELYHFESKTRGTEDTFTKQKRFDNEVKFFLEKWGDVLAFDDPYYNPNFTADKEDFSLRISCKRT